MAETKQEPSEVEKAKAKWIDEYKKNPAEKMYEIYVGIAVVQGQNAELNLKIDQLNPQATLQRQVMSVVGAVVDMNRRLAELEKPRKS